MWLRAREAVATCFLAGDVRQVWLHHDTKAPMVACRHDDGVHILFDDQQPWFDVVEPIFVSAAQKSALKSAVQIAYGDDDAPIFDEGVDGKALVDSLEAMFA